MWGYIIGCHNVNVYEGYNSDHSEIFRLMRLGCITDSGKRMRGIKKFTSLDELEGCVQTTQKER